MIDQTPQMHKKAPHQRQADQNEGQRRQPAHQVTRDRAGAMHDRDPAHAEAKQESGEVEAPMKGHEKGHTVTSPEIRCGDSAPCQPRCRYRPPAASCRNRSPKTVAPAIRTWSDIPA